MSDPDLSIRSAFSPRALLTRTVIACGVIFAAVGWQVVRGRARLTALALPRVHLHAPRLELLAHAPELIRVHVAAAVVALLIGSALLAGVKGSRLHKIMGWTWVATMATTAVSSLWIRVVDPGHWSFIHFVSGWIIIALPLALVAIKRRNVRLHRRMMTGMFTGGLLVAGGLTFLPGRLMWAVFLG